MTDLTSESQIMNSTIIRLWQRVPVLIRAIVVGFVVFEIGVGALARIVIRAEQR